MSTTPDFALDAIDTVPASEAGAELTILGLDGKPMLNALDQPLTFKLRGPDSSVYRRVMRTVTAERMQAAQAAKEAGETLDAERVQADAEADGIRVMVACTISWSGFLDRERKAIECTPANVAALLSRYPVIREQVDAFIYARKNFLPVSSMG